MLNPKELKIVLETLSKRRTWLRKTIDAPSTDAAHKTVHQDLLKQLESAIQKLSAGATSAAPSVSAATLTQAAKPRSKITTANARILIAEDNPDSAQLLTEILNDMGFKLIDVAEDGMQAFDKIKANTEGYDAVLCDWDMPEISGLDVHQKAKASNTLKGAHFIMVTAVSDSARIRKAIQQGVNDYIVKPVDMAVLEGKLRTALNIQAS